MSYVFFTERKAQLLKPFPEEISTSQQTGQKPFNVAQKQAIYLMIQAKPC